MLIAGDIGGTQTDLAVTPRNLVHTRRWLMLRSVSGISIVPQHGLLMTSAAVLILRGLQLRALGLLGEWQYFIPFGDGLPGNGE